MLLVIFSLWVIFNGRVTVETMLLGAVISVGVYWFACKYLGYATGTDRKVARSLLRMLRYAAVLVWEIVKANVQVSKIIYSKKPEVQPQIVFFRSHLKSTAARVVLANSITLTPGTLTVVLNDDLFCVHSLNGSLAGGIDSSVFVTQLSQIEGV